MLTKNRFDFLRSVTAQPCVTIYMPTERTGDYEANRIRWKNILRNASERLEEKGFEDKMLRKASEMVGKDDVWAHQAEGLAAFITEDEMHLVQMMEKPEPLVEVVDHFSLGQLARELNLNHAVYILALSRNSVKLYRANACMIKEVHIADKVVLSEKEALRNLEDDQSLQHHSTGYGNAKHHGNSSQAELDTVRLEQFMRRVDDGLLEVIHDRHVPLVLAAVEEYLPRYRKVSSYPNISDFIIAGNPDHRSPHDLHRSLQAYYAQRHQAEVAAFHQQYSAKEFDKLTTDDLAQIAALAKVNNIESFLVGKDRYRSLSRSERQLLDKAIVSVCDQGGKVLYSDDADVGVMAILRYRMYDA